MLVVIRGPLLLMGPFVTYHDFGPDWIDLGHVFGRDFLFGLAFGGAVDLFHAAVQAGASQK
jgi:hypothetical protein